MGSPTEVNDLISIQELDNDQILRIVKHRFNNGQFYTYIGDVLLAVNPCRELAIYDEKYHNKYRNLIARQSESPHVFWTAEHAFRSLKETRSKQCIVVSGESGAGKTESTKYVLKHLINRAECAIPDLVEKLDEINPLVELFGNAETVFNPNSSRFGKLIELCYGIECQLLGGKLETFVLEKSRVVHHGIREKNYHIFHAFFSGMDEQYLRQYYFIEHPTSYRILQADGVLPHQSTGIFANYEERESFKVKFNQGVRTMKKIGITEKEIHQLWEILSAILHIGNIDFIEDDETNATTFLDAAPVLTAAQMLGFDDDESSLFMTALLQTKALAAGEEMIRVKSIRQAEEERDALVKELYTGLFNGIIAKVNETLQPSRPSSSGMSIGMLDISGFENLVQTQNSFEQLLINITNEKLHQYFQKQIFEEEAKDYKKEGIKASEIPFTGNQEVLKVLFESPGILSILEDEIAVPGSTDATLVKKYNKHCSHSPCFRENKNHLLFGILHYAGEVQYNAEGFLDKNKGTLSNSLKQCILQSKNVFVETYFDMTGTIRMSRFQSNGMLRGGKKSTGKMYSSAAFQYKKSLNDLNDNLSKAKPLFIRCVKPNVDLAEGVFSDSQVRNQLLGCGILDVTNMRREGYPVRIKLDIFVSKYKELLADPSMHDTHSKVKEIMRISGLSNVLIGKTKVFLRCDDADKIDETVERKRKEEERKREEEKERLRKQRESRLQRSHSRSSNRSKRSLTRQESSQSYKDKEISQNDLKDMKKPSLTDPESKSEISENESSGTSLPPPYDDVTGQKEESKDNKLPIWDIFRLTERDDVGCENVEALVLKLSRAWMYILLFSLILGFGSSCILIPLALSTQLRHEDAGISTKVRTEIFIASSVPYGLVWILSLLKICFGSKGKLQLHLLIMMMVLENAQVVGTVLLLYKVLPSISSIWGLAVIMAIVVFPAILNLYRQIVLSKNIHRKLPIRFVAVATAFMSVAIQVSFYFILGFDSVLAEEKSFQKWDSKQLFYVFLSLLLISIGWTEPFIVSNVCCIPLLKWKRQIQKSREKLDFFLITSKCLTFYLFASILASSFSLSLSLPSEKQFEFDSFKWINTVPRVHSGYQICITQEIYRLLSFSTFAMTLHTNNTETQQSLNTSRDNVTENLNQTTTPIPTEIITDYEQTLKLSMDSSVTCSYPANENGKLVSKTSVMDLFADSCNMYKTHPNWDNDTLLPTEDKSVFRHYCEYHNGNFLTRHGLMLICSVACIILCYAAVLACKLHMQRFAFSLALILCPLACFVAVGPFCYSGTIFEGSFTCTTMTMTEMKGTISIMAMLWLSLVLTTWHIWFPACERMAKFERMFTMPVPDGLFSPLSLLFRRKMDDYEEQLYRKEKHLKKKYDKRKRTKRDRPLIYVCATMWHETRQEMLQLLKSLFRLDYYHSQCLLAEKTFKVEVDYFEVSIHVIFDDAFLTDPKTKQRVTNDWVQQLVECIDEAAMSVAKGNIEWDRQPQKIITPYGGRLSWTMPGGTEMTFHLKDKDKIRHRKRWSQVMYMYYLLGFKFMEDKDPNEVNNPRVVHKWRKNVSLLNHFERRVIDRAYNSFILALDGDVDFKPEAVKLLIDKMKKNDKVAAVCGRIHPIGSGPMVWYQQFEYSVGHWLQKAAEHVFGCVLCCPGCFSLFRSAAVMDDNVMRRYTAPPIEASHFIQFEQGEDRWLCTLLLQQGWKIEYCAGSDALTYAPETFKDFFVQRRRWAPSTMANIIDLISSWCTTVSANDNISSLYMFYQFLLLASSLLAPGAVTLMIAGSYSAVFAINPWYGLIMSLAPVIGYILICLKMKNDYQIMVAGLMSSVYAVVMVIVTVGTLLNVIEEPLYSPNVIFLVGLASIFVIAGIIHPKEIFNLGYGMLYYLTVPSTFVFLTIYYLCNIHNVSWGTREGPKQPTTEEENQQQATQKKKEKKTGMQKLLNAIGLTSISREIGSLISKALGKETNGNGNTNQSAAIQPVLPIQVTRQIQQNLSHEVRPMPPPQEPEVELDSTVWANQAFLGDKTVQETGPMETRFWEYTIKKYLLPLNEDKKQKEKIGEDLITLRNNIVFGFFLLNLLFLIFVFQLQINEDALKGVYLLGQYEPVSLAFLGVFAIILLTQFAGMMIHRWGTYQHLIASTTLGFCSRTASNETYAQLAIKEAGKLQSAVHDNSTDGDEVSNEDTLRRMEPVDPDYPEEDELPDYSDDEEAADYPDDELADRFDGSGPQHNAYARMFEQRFDTRRRYFENNPRRFSQPRNTFQNNISTHHLYNRTVRGLNNWNSHRNQYDSQNRQSIQHI